MISCNSGDTYITKASLGIRLIWDLIYFWFSLNEVKIFSVEGGKYKITKAFCLGAGEPWIRRFKVGCVCVIRDLVEFRLD